MFKFGVFDQRRFLCPRATRRNLPQQVVGRQISKTREKTMKIRAVVILVERDRRGETPLRGASDAKNEFPNALPSGLVANDNWNR
jgi:hypothetical protein